MISHDVAAMRQTAHRMVYLEEQIWFDGPPPNFPSVEEIASLRGIQDVHGGHHYDHAAEHCGGADHATSLWLSFKRRWNDGSWCVAARACFPAMEAIAPYLPGDVFPFFFTLDMFQRVLVASFVITVIAGVLGSFLLIRNMALIGDGIAHVTFGGVAVSMVLAGVPTLPMATFFAVVAAVLIFELQDRGLLEGDTAIAIMMTGALAFGLVALRMWGEGITANVERFLYGNVLFVDDASLDWICTVGLVALLLLGAMYKGLLCCCRGPSSPPEYKASP